MSMTSAAAHEFAEAVRDAAEMAEWARSAGMHDLADECDEEAGIYHDEFLWQTYQDSIEEAGA
jgi:hypothetical protein